MNKEQAIEIIKTHSDDISSSSLLGQALNMAIDALKAQLSNEGTTKDAISRQAAIDLFPNDVLEWDTLNGYIAPHVARRLIEQLPPAQTEPQWIPVSECVPYIDMSYPHSEHYLVQYDSGDMDVASWSNVNRFWTDHVTKPYWNCVQFAKVIAWMPLPEAYEERRER